MEMGNCNLRYLLAALLHKGHVLELINASSCCFLDGVEQLVLWTLLYIDTVFT